MCCACDLGTKYYIRNEYVKGENESDIFPPSILEAVTTTSPIQSIRWQAYRLSAVQTRFLHMI